MQTEGLMQNWGWTHLCSPDIELLLAFPDAYRIHPDDAHLQYGPISTALRELAEDTTWKYSSDRVLAITAANEFQVYLGGVRDDYPLFYLILAEFLADEGM
tara:strand:- start:1372 stop:1674 length:303 start_codon:yes stop_codon:yes gene_type:complete